MSEWKVEESFDGERVDKFLHAMSPELTRSYLQKLIDDGCVQLNGKKLAKNYKVSQGDVIVLHLPELRALSLEAQDIPLEIVYEDEDLLVVNKPKGMVVHPAPGNFDSTMVNALLYHCRGSLSGINGVERPGIVHRIDKMTSGLLIVAKNDSSHKHLAAQIKAHSFTREYQAVVCGSFQQESGDIDAPIGRHPVNRKKMAVTEKNSKPAKTHFEVLERLDGFTHVLCRLYTGRTHQIRVHMSYIGHPVLGDEVYGGKKFKGLEGQCLHAAKIGFIHPSTGQYIEFSSDLPDYFIKVLTQLKKGKERSE